MSPDTEALEGAGLAGPCPSPAPTCGDASPPLGPSASVTSTLVQGRRGTRSRCHSAVQTSGRHREPASPFGAGEELGAFEMHVVTSVTPEVSPHLARASLGRIHNVPFSLLRPCHGPLHHRILTLSPFISALFCFDGEILREIVRILWQVPIGSDIVVNTQFATVLSDRPPPSSSWGFRIATP